MNTTQESVSNIAEVSSFSIALESGIYLDYNWEKPDEWRRSEKDGVRWFHLGPMQSENVPAFLRKFGLDEVYVGKTHAPPLSKLCVMSPAELIAIRRKWERRHNKPTLQVRSDLNNGRIRAEDIVRSAKKHSVA